MHDLTHDPLFGLSLTRLEAWLEEERRARHIPGLSIAIVAGREADLFQCRLRGT